MPLSNARLADLLYGASEDYSEQRARALRRAGRAALTWREEAAALAESGRELTELPSVGPWIAAQIESFLASPPDTEPGRFRSGFHTMAEALVLLEEHPDWKRDLQGDLQMHTTYSDGVASAGEMTAAAIERGYSYIAITDHSKGLRIAGGMNEERLLEQVVELEALDADLASAGAEFTILRSIELNFGRSGEGDMDSNVLDALDVVVGSFHSRLRVSEDQTERCLGAVRNKHVQIVGHPRGRMFGVREGVVAQWPRIFEEGARTGKAYEINAQPNRQDLSVELLRSALETGAMFSIGTDAHSVAELDNIDLSLAAAIRAGIGKERIVNFLPPDRLRGWVAASRDAARSAPRR